jgi:hypothetical protein
MKIPTKYQIFDDSIEIPDKDVERLSSCIGGWNRLHELFMLGGLNEVDLKRLVVMELMGKQRQPLIARLLGRLAKLDRQRYTRRIDQVINL